MQVHFSFLFFLLTMPSSFADCPENPALSCRRLFSLPGGSHSLFIPAGNRTERSFTLSPVCDIDSIYCLHVSILPTLSASIFIGVFDRPRLSALRIGVVVRRSCRGVVLVHTLRMPHILAHDVSPLFSNPITHELQHHVCVSYVYGHRETR